MTLLVVLLKPDGFIKTLAIIITSIIFYSVLLIIFRSFEKKEILLLKGIFKKI